MNVNVVGRINNVNLPRTHGMMAIYGAIINSIYAIEQVAPKRETFIHVLLYRDMSQTQIPDGTGISSEPIVDVSIQDNGIGFDEINYKAFQTSDTTLKQAIGGKGIGRFVWLKVFERVEVKSSFAGNDTIMCRCFDFLPTENGISDHDKSPVGDSELLTEVKLKGLRQEYLQ